MEGKKLKEKKLTDEEIVKALGICLTEVEIHDKDDCKDCPYFIKKIDCVTGKRSENDYFDLIQRQKAEIERLTELQSRGSYRVAELGIENAELQKRVDELENRFENKACCNMSENCSMVQQTVKDTAKEIFDKIFEALCCFTTQGKSKEYNEGYIQCLEEIDERLQKLAKEKGVEVE